VHHPQNNEGIKINKKKNNRAITSGQLFCDDSALMSHAIFLLLHSASDRASNQGSFPLRKSEISTSPWSK
jgi:hypothetical protein